MSTPEAEVGLEGDPEVAATEQEYRLADWDSSWNLYRIVRYRPIQVCIEYSGTTPAGTLQLFTQFAVFDWINSVQSVSNSQLFVHPTFGCGAHDIKLEVQPFNANTPANYNGPRILVWDRGDLYLQILHEFGHAFGLHDTYAAQNTPGTCLWGHPNSVMCYGNFGGLQPDDVRGAQQSFRKVNPDIYSGPRPLKGFDSGRCIDIDGFGTTNGIRTQLWDCGGIGPTHNQVWAYDANTQAFVNPASGRCLDVAGAGTAPSTPVHIWDCHGGANQRWEFLGDGRIRSVHTGMCLDAAGSGNGTSIVVYPCHNGNNQRWWFF